MPYLSTCPHCGKSISKLIGSYSNCNHKGSFITCDRCKAKICYGCGAKYAGS